MIDVPLPTLSPDQIGYLESLGYEPALYLDCPAFGRLVVCSGTPSKRPTVTLSFRTALHRWVEVPDYASLRHTIQTHPEKIPAIQEAWRYANVTDLFSEEPEWLRLRPDPTTLAREGLGAASSAGVGGASVPVRGVSGPEEVVARAAGD